jgi:hypothetical protein
METEALIRQLDDDQFEVREQAQQRLTLLRWSVEPQLRAALEGAISIETRARLDYVLAIDTNRARAS